MNKWKVIEYNKKIEKALVNNYGAQGKGLHSKLTSVEDKLAPDLVKKIRFIASVRNKLVHDANYKDLPKDFIRTNKEVLKELTKSKNDIISWIIFILLLIALAIVIYIRFKNGFS
jgi:hypothetical protein